MQLDPVNNEDHTQHVMQWACPRRGPAHQQRAMEARLLHMRSPCLEFADTSWECGRETLSLTIHDKANERTPGIGRLSKIGVMMLYLLCSWSLVRESHCPK